MRPFQELVDYWLGDAADEALEEHLLGCAECSARLEELAALGAGIRKAFRSGALHAVLPRGFAERLKRDGLRIREYRVSPGASVNCTITSQDDFVLSRLVAPLAGVERLDVEVLDAEGAPRERLEDVPFDPGSGEVLFMPRAAALRRMPAHVERLRLVAVTEGERRALGEYTFVHTPG